MTEFLWKALASGLLTVLIKGGVALFQHSIAWWTAALIALVVVFGGFLILDSDGDWWS